MTLESMLSIAEKYGLRRENFILDPLRDSECFARVDIDTRDNCGRHRYRSYYRFGAQTVYFGARTVAGRRTH